MPTMKEYPFFEYGVDLSKATPIVKYNPFLKYDVDLSTRPKLLPNQQMGNLTLLKRNRFKYSWTCRCALCKQTQEIDEALLLTGLLTSCGCDGPIIKEPEPDTSTDIESEPSDVHEQN